MVVRANIGLPVALQGLERPYTLQNEMPTYLTDLGLAYQVSGDPRFGRRVIELLSALGDAGFPYWCCQDLGVGDLDAGLALGFDWTYQLMTPAERARSSVTSGTTPHLRTGCWWTDAPGGPLPDEQLDGRDRRRRRARWPWPSVASRARRPASRLPQPGH